MAANDNGKCPCTINFINSNGVCVGERTREIAAGTDVMHMIWRLRLELDNPRDIVRVIVDIALS